MDAALQDLRRVRDGLDEQDQAKPKKLYSWKVTRRKSYIAEMVLLKYLEKSQNSIKTGNYKEILQQNSCHILYVQRISRSTHRILREGSPG